MDSLRKEEPKSQVKLHDLAAGTPAPRSRDWHLKKAAHYANLAVAAKEAGSEANAERMVWMTLRQLALAEAKISLGASEAASVEDIKSGLQEKGLIKADDARFSTARASINAQVEGGNFDE